MIGWRSTGVGRRELLVRQPDGARPENPVLLAVSSDVVLASIGLSVPVALFYRSAGIA